MPFGGLRMLDLVVLFVVALLVFGPKKLPELSRSIGASIQQFKKGIDDLKSSGSSEHVEAELPAQKTAAELRSELEMLEREIANRKAANDMQTPFYDAAPSTGKAPTFE